MFRWDIAVDPPFRRQGIGRRLIVEAVAWARGRGLPGVMLETQNIPLKGTFRNVPACRLYERCGFVLSGFDACRYRGVMPGTREIALFWHLLIRIAGACGSRETEFSQYSGVRRTLQALTQAAAAAMGSARTW